jgi:hypothetical protein
VLSQLGYTPPKGILGNFVVAPSDEWLATANLLSLNASLAIPTRVLRFEVSECVVAHRSNQSSAAASGLRPWLFGSTKKPSDFLETLRTWCSLRRSPLKTRLPRSPVLTLVLRLNQETVHDFVLLLLPPCGPHLTPLSTRSLEPSLLVFSTPRGLTDNDLSHLFSPAPTTVKPQPAPAILSQESVHTMLSITHHTRKRPSIDPQTTQVLILPLMSALTRHTFGNQREKENKRND